MKKFILLSALIVLTFLQKALAMDIIKLRDLYYQASTDKKASEKFAIATSSASDIEKTTLAGYSGM